MTFRGKEYIPKKATMMLIQRVSAIEKKMQELNESLMKNPDLPDYEKKYGDLWAQKVSAILEGDVKDLSAENITAMEAAELESFFLEHFTGGRMKSSEPLTDTK